MDVLTLNLLPTLWIVKQNPGILYLFIKQVTFSQLVVHVLDGISVCFWPLSQAGYVIVIIIKAAPTY